MKTLETETTLSKVSAILSPVRLLTVDEWIQIADAIIAPQGRKSDAEIQMINIIHCISRFEELTRGKWVTEEIISGEPFRSNAKNPNISDTEYLHEVDEARFAARRIWQPALLKKEHFVCDLEEPKITQIQRFQTPQKSFEAFQVEYYEAQEQLIFEGCEFEINEGSRKELTTKPYSNLFILGEDTVYDLIYLVDRANKDKYRDKIKINFTESFIKKLIG